MLSRIFAALTALLFARCIIGDTVRVRQMPSPYDAAFSDWASILSISDDLGSYFNDVAIDNPGAADDWEPALAQIQNITNLINDSVSQLRSLATGLHPAPETDLLTWTECYILLAVYDLTWKTVSGVLFPLAAAAKFFSAEARSQFWYTQNTTSYLALDLSGTVDQLCNDYSWQTDESFGSHSMYYGAQCAMECLAGLPGGLCFASNLTCPVIPG